MKNVKISLVLSPSVEPVSFIGGLARLTQLKKEFEPTTYERGLKILDSLMAYGHTSLLEALDFGVVVSGASRVFLAQLTRHRLASYVSQSQQYQDHDNFPFTVPESIASNEEALTKFENCMRDIDALYTELKTLGISRDDARYVLPGAASNDLFIKANAREWLLSFFKLRLCKRNTPEVMYIMRLILTLFMEHGYGPIFQYAGPACVTCGQCDQGKMTCGEPFRSREELLVCS